MIKAIVIHILSPLVIGGLIYISFRSLSLRMFNWFDVIGVNNLALCIRNYINPLKVYIPTCIYFSLPDGLWIYSFTSTILMIWKTQIENSKLLLLPLLFCVGIEVAQGLNLTSGTFDIVDLTFYIIAFTLSIILQKTKIKNYEKQIL